MLPYFNTSGPCVPGQHYMLPPERRLGRVMSLIEEGRYFTLHAGRQTGKTTSARWLVKHHNAGNRYCAVWVDIQTAREAPEPTEAFATILSEFRASWERDLSGLPVPATDALLVDPRTCVVSFLREVARATPRPLIVLIDEVDGLVGETMVSFLTQLRRGYMDRSSVPFPHSIVLIGMRQVRDYVVSEEERRAVSWLGTTSPFNITAESQTLTPFTEEDVNELLAQHTTATGQRFEDDAVRLVFELSQGHPWLVNALADEAIRREAPERSMAVTAEHIERAKETIILERRTHIDSLIARLREPRVRRVMEPMLVGDRTAGDAMSDDFAYVVGLGLVGLRDGRYEIANPIYREVIPRALSFDQQAQMREETSWYVRSDGSLDIGKLLGAFQEFWRKDGHVAAEGFTYREAGPHLMLMAFLQRVVNAGGRVEREYGLGRGALDLLVEWGEDRHAIEVKVRRGSHTEEDVLEQVVRYLDHLGMNDGWVVTFDPRRDIPWSEKLTRRDIDFADKTIHFVGC